MLAFIKNRLTKIILTKLTQLISRLLIRKLKTVMVNIH